MTADPQTTKVMVEYVPFEKAGEFWIEIRVDRTYRGDFGPFDTAGECDRALDDLLEHMRERGAVDLPRPQ